MELSRQIKASRNLDERLPRESATGLAPQPVTASEKSQKPAMPPRSTLDLPAVSHYPKIHSADQLGPVCLGGFHGGHSLLQSARV